MKRKTIGLLFLALIISWSAVAETEMEEGEKTVKEHGAIQQVEETLESGIGWQLVRVLEFGKTGKRVYVVLVEQSKYTDKTIYSNAITRLCADEEIFCRVRFWSQERHLSEKISLTIDQHKQLKAEYTFDKVARVHKTLMSCSVEPSRVDCVP